MELNTHAVLDAELDRCRVGELTLSARPVRSAGLVMLIRADREFLGVRLRRAFTAAGDRLLGQVSAIRVLTASGSSLGLHGWS
ncbi:hypothetical protein ACWD25_05125 [Streptomyces sp. NPDC002920]